VEEGEGGVAAFLSPPTLTDYPRSNMRIRS
jgi:hypothetical protein